MKIWTLLSLMICCISVSAQRYQKKMEQSYTVEVKEVKWATDITDNFPFNELDKGVASTSRGLVFWARLVGNEEALKFLESRHQLPVQFKFFKNSVTGTTPERFYVMESNLIDGGEEVNSKSGGVTLNKDEFYKKLKEVNANGIFEFYVWSRFSSERLKGTERLTASIVLKDNSDAKCPQKTCEYFIRIQ